MQKMYEDQTANDATKGNAFVATGRPIGFHAFGTPDTSSIQVFESVDGTDNGEAVSSLVFTAEDFAIYTPAAGSTIWATMASVGASTDMNLFASGR